MYVMQKDEKGKMGISSCIWYYAGCWMQKNFMESHTQEIGAFLSYIYVCMYACLQGMILRAPLKRLCLSRKSGAKNKEWSWRELPRRSIDRSIHGEGSDAWSSIYQGIGRLKVL
jgi:hypothetical protein